jgi:transcriptional regulator with XRE-family HTH domain
MKYSEYKKNLEQNPEYREAKAELELGFAFGDAVLRARLRKGWTQTELARRVGTRQANISRIEAGLANPTLELIQKVCKALELQPEFRQRQKASQRYPVAQAFPAEHAIAESLE